MRIDRSGLRGFTQPPLLASKRLYTPPICIPPSYKFSALPRRSTSLAAIENHHCCLIVALHPFVHEELVDKCQMHA